MDLVNLMVNITTRKKYFKQKELYYTESYIFDTLFAMEHSHQELSQRYILVILGIWYCNLNSPGLAWTHPGMANLIRN